MTRRGQGILVALAVIMGIALVGGGVVVLARSGGSHEAALNVIRGNNKPNKLIGTNGPDKILGRGAGDEIKGRGAHDVLKGGKGGDHIGGGKGFDRIEQRSRQRPDQRARRPSGPDRLRPRKGLRQGGPPRGRGLRLRDGPQPEGAELTERDRHELEAAAEERSDHNMGRREFLAAHGRRSPGSPGSARSLPADTLVAEAAQAPAQHAASPARATCRSTPSSC